LGRIGEVHKYERHVATVRKPGEKREAEKREQDVGNLKDRGTHKSFVKGSRKKKVL